MIRRPPRSTLSSSSAASDVYKRQDEFAGDIAGVNFDSYHDYRTGFEFSVTSWGQKIDLVLFNPNNWDLNWNPVWKVKTGLEDSAWVAEYELSLIHISE